MRLCRGGSRTLRIPGVYLPLLLSLCRGPLFSNAAAVAVVFVFHRLRSGPFEGPATVKPPALPEDTYLDETRDWRRGNRGQLYVFAQRKYQWVQDFREFLGSPGQKSEHYRRGKQLRKDRADRRQPKSSGTGSVMAASFSL